MTGFLETLARRARRWARARDWDEGAVLLALGAFIGVIMLWVKIVRESLRRRSAPDEG